jgi:pimeloyl-ACP methyl ester carboxylesterase
MKTGPYLSRWKSEQAERRFRAMEDELVAELVTAVPEALDVATRLGPTRVYRWPGTGEPVVFLHGATGTSLMWAPYAEHRHGRAMYAIDTIGDVGRSRQEVAIQGEHDLAGWLVDTLDAAGLERPHFAGTSYGAFLALNLAASEPARVRSLFLVEPAGLTPVHLFRFMVWGFSALFASVLPGPARRVAARRLRMPALENKDVMRLVAYGQRHHRAQRPPPGPLTDEQLRNVVQPARVLLGAKSAPLPAREVRTRAAMLPNVDIEVVPDAGHALTMSHREHVEARLDDFLRRRAMGDA